MNEANEHVPSVEKLSRLQHRKICTCGAIGPIRRTKTRAAQEEIAHRELLSN
jgi:hypothetical protein